MALLFGAYDKGFAFYDNRADCFSCTIHIDNLEKPIPLSGNWLFTREDHSNYAAATLDTRHWRLAKTPGNWGPIYDDKKNYRVGWYRGTFHFSPSLIGQKVILLVDTYMAKTDVYIDGALAFTREGVNSYQRYYSAQAIPVHFKVTRTEHTIAIRVDTILMKGVYQRPFQLRAYKKFDPLVAFIHFYAGEFRAIIAHIFMAFGFFFVFIYFKTQHTFYLVAGLSGILLYPFTGFPNDFLLKFFDPETMIKLHYLGNGMMVISHFLIPQFFYRPWPIATAIHVSVVGLCMMAFVYFAIFFNLDAFIQLRKFYFIYALFFGINLLIYLGIATAQRIKGMRLILFGETVSVILSLHDAALGLDKIDSIVMVTISITISQICLVIFSINMFSNTFLENKRVVNELTTLNNNLEHIVNKRTKTLEKKTNEIGNILDNIPQGILTINHQLLIQKEHSAYLCNIFDKQDIANSSVFDLIFDRSQLDDDQLHGMKSALAAILGEDTMNFEFNIHHLPTNIQIVNRHNKIQILELTWSPIIENGTVERLMISIRDISDVKRLEREATMRERELVIVSEIINITPATFDDFIANAESLASNSKQLAQDLNANSMNTSLATILQNIHTIKGNARTLKLKSLSDASHQVEDEIVKLQSLNT